MKIDTSHFLVPAQRDGAKAPPAGPSFKSMLDSASWSRDAQDPKKSPSKPPKRQHDPARRQSPQIEVKGRSAEIASDPGVTTAPLAPDAADARAFGFAERGVFGSYAGGRPPAGAPSRPIPVTEAAPDRAASGPARLAEAGHQEFASKPANSERPASANIAASPSIQARSESKERSTFIAGPALAVSTRASSAQQGREPVPLPDAAAAPLRERKARASVIVSEDDGAVQVVAATTRLPVGAAERLRRVAADLCSRLGLRLIAFALNGVVLPTSSNPTGASHGPSSH